MSQDFIGIARNLQDAFGEYKLSVLMVENTSKEPSPCREGQVREGSLVGVPAGND